MQAAGLELFENRDLKKSSIYSFENEPKQLSAAFLKMFKADKKAWAFFSTQAPSYQRTTIHWIMTAKQEATQLARLQKTIKASEQGKRL